MNNVVAEILVDIFEEASGVPTELERLGVTVGRRSLSVGDYDVGCGTIIERKTAADLTGSLESGRLWSQLHRLRQCSTFPVLLIEGSREGVSLGSNAWRGLVLAVSDQGIVVLQSQDQRDTAHWICDLARRRSGRASRDRPPYAYRKRSRKSQPGEAVLAAIDGLSVHHARALLRTFGSVRAVVEAGPEQWMAVEGIGPKRSTAMRNALGEGRLH